MTERRAMTETTKREDFVLETPWGLPFSPWPCPPAPWVLLRLEGRRTRLDPLFTPRLILLYYLFSRQFGHSELKDLEIIDNTRIIEDRRQYERLFGRTQRGK